MINWLRVREMVRKEWRQLFRDPKSKRIVFASPILQLVLFGYAVNTDVHDVAMFVVDHENTAESRALVSAFVAPGYFRLAGHSDRPSDIGAALDAGRARVGLHIPPGFTADLLAGRGATVQLLIDGTSSNTATVAQGYAARIVQDFGLQYVDARTLHGGVDLRTRAWFNPDLRSRVYNIPAVIGTILLLMSLLLTALAVVREREIGTLDQLLVSPLTPTELMLGKTLPVAVIAMIDLAMITAISLLWFDIPLRGSVFALLAASTVYVIAALGMGLYISSGARTQQEAFMTMFLFLLPAIVLSGFMYPVDTMPPFFQYLTLANPLRHFLEIVRAIFLRGAGMMDILPQFATLTVMAGAILWLAGRRFRGALG